MKHIIKVKIRSVQGIQVLDQKRHGSNSLRTLNKITANVALSRHEYSKSFGSSLPLVPSTHVQSIDGSFRYDALWDDQDIDSQAMALETDLQPIEKNSSTGREYKQRGHYHAHIQSKEDTSSDGFALKRFYLVLSLRRNDEHIPLAYSSVKFGPTKKIRCRLPLTPMGPNVEDPNSRNMWNRPPVCFDLDPARTFGLANDAYMEITISCKSNTETNHELLPFPQYLQSSNSHFGESFTTAPSFNTRKHYSRDDRRNVETESSKKHDRRYRNRRTSSMCSKDSIEYRSDTNELRGRRNGDREWRNSGHR